MARLQECVRSAAKRSGLRRIVIEGPEIIARFAVLSSRGELALVRTFAVIDAALVDIAGHALRTEAMRALWDLDKASGSPDLAPLVTARLHRAPAAPPGGAAELTRRRERAAEVVRALGWDDVQPTVPPGASMLAVWEELGPRGRVAYGYDDRSIERLVLARAVREEGALIGVHDLSQRTAPRLGASIEVALAVDGDLARVRARI